jgi:L-threonylcarbamoyladenylate synthase
VESSRVISRALEVLKNGGLIIYPTETSYGLGADITNHAALEKLLAYKGARTSPISIAVSSMAMAKDYVVLSPIAKKLYQKYLPGPLTIISKSRETVDPIISAGTATLGVRIPNFPLTLELINLLGHPITATSANISGGVTPYSLEEYQNSTPPEKSALIGFFLNAGELPRKNPSTVVKAIGDDLVIVRQGDIVPRL